MSREPSRIFGRAKKRCKPHSRAIARLARMLIDQGMELAENGRELQEMDGAFDAEGRLRILAGGLVADVGHCVLIDARSSVMRRRLRALELDVRKAVKIADPDRKPCGEPGCNGYLHLGAGPDGVVHTWCPKAVQENDTP